MARLAIVVGFVVLSLGGSVASHAQDSADRYFPPAEALGEGWVEVERESFEANAEAFRAGAVALYGGPAGARAVLYVYLLNDPSAIRRSWELATDSYESMAHQHAEGWYWNDEDLVGLPAPAGCADIKRAEGPDGYYRMTGGVVLCAADPDAVLIVVASGEIAGETSYRAAQVVIEAALAAADQATPSA